MSLIRKTLDNLVCEEVHRLRIYKNIPGLVCSIRDHSGRVLWCNGEFSFLMQRDGKSIRNCTYHSAMRGDAADERLGFLQESLTRESELSYYQIGADSLFMCKYTPIFLIDIGSYASITANVPCRFLDNGTQFMKTACMDQLSQLSSITRQVFHFVIQGKSNEEIAGLLHRSPRTIEGHAAKLLASLNVKTRSELVNWGVKKGLDSIPHDIWCNLTPIPVCFADSNGS